MPIPDVITKEDCPEHNKPLPPDTANHSKARVGQATVHSTVSHLKSTQRGSKALALLDKLTTIYAGMDSLNRKALEEVVAGMADYPNTIQSAIKGNS